MLGCSFRDGEGGPKDLQQAAHWFKVAADLGQTQACTNLGIAYMRGGWGAAKPNEWRRSATSREELMRATSSR